MVPWAFSGEIFQMVIWTPGLICFPISSRHHGLFIGFLMHSWMEENTTHRGKVRGSWEVNAENANKTGSPLTWSKEAPGNFGRGKKTEPLVIKEYSSYSRKGWLFPRTSQKKEAGLPSFWTEWSRAGKGGPPKQNPRPSLLPTPAGRQLTNIELSRNLFPASYVKIETFRKRKGKCLSPHTGR